MKSIKIILYPVFYQNVGNISVDIQRRGAKLGDAAICRYLRRTARGADASTYDGRYHIPAVNTAAFHRSCNTAYRYFSLKQWALKCCNRTLHSLISVILINISTKLSTYLLRFLGCDKLLRIFEWYRKFNLLMLW